MASPALRRAGALLLLAVIGATFGLVMRTQWVYPVRITSNSMAPTIRAGDWVLVSASDDGPAIRRGDVILYRYTAPGSERAIKRVVALAGEAVGVAGPRLPLAGCAGAGPGSRCVTVPEGHVFILGDNTTASLDSRSLGPLPAREVLGRVRWVLRAGP